MSHIPIRSMEVDPDFEMQHFWNQKLNILSLQNNLHPRIAVQTGT